jgi:hypothetical protein
MVPVAILPLIVHHPADDASTFGPTVDSREPGGR